MCILEFARGGGRCKIRVFVKSTMFHVAIRRLISENNPRTRTMADHQEIIHLISKSVKNVEKVKKVKKSRISHLKSINRQINWKLVSKISKILTFLKISTCILSFDWILLSANVTLGVEITIRIIVWEHSKILVWYAWDSVGCCF